MDEQPSRFPDERPPGFWGSLLQTRYREVTLSAVIFGILIGAVMNAAITYAGLKIGFTIGGSAIAAILGFGVLRGILRRGSILENNIGQTVASAVNLSNAGIIFTVPVLYLLVQENGDRFQFNPWMMTLATMAGAVLGCTFIIPLRKQMIDIERLRFPSATAVGAILKSPGAGIAKSIVLLIGVVIAMLIYFPTQLTSLELPGLASLPWIGTDHGGVLGNDRIDVGKLLHMPDQIQFVFAIAPFAIGAGYLTGRAGLVVLAGGLLAYFIINPIAFASGWTPAGLDAGAVPGYALNTFNRPLGIGLLLGGALMGVLAALPAIKAALGSVRISTGGSSKDSDELGLKPLMVAGAIGVVLLFVTAEFMIGKGSTRTGLLGDLPPFAGNIIIALIGCCWIWFAGIIIAQCTGMTDWSPISGLALLTVVLVMALAGTGEVVGAVLIGATLCVAISGAADMMADLRTGYIVGAQPKRQQVLELLTVGIGPAITMLTLVIIVHGQMKQHGVPLGPGTDLVAPQAQALQAVIIGVQGGEMPYALYGFGAILGVLLGLGSFAGLGVLVGLSMYLPIIYILPYGVGCIINIIVGKIKGRSWAEEWGVPFCAGLIVGEALLALLINSIVIVRSAT